MHPKHTYSTKWKATILTEIPVSAHFGLIRWQIPLKVPNLVKSLIAKLSDAYDFKLIGFVCGRSSQRNPSNRGSGGQS